MLGGAETVHSRRRRTWLHKNRYRVTAQETAQMYSQLEVDSTEVGRSGLPKHPYEKTYIWARVRGRIFASSLNMTYHIYHPPLFGIENRLARALRKQLQVILSDCQADGHDLH